MNTNRSTAYLEHANITVNNLQGFIDFIQLAIPEFKIRGRGESENGRPWIHIGTAESYLAVNEVPEQLEINKDYNKSGLNHFGFVVGDVNSLADRLLKSGYKRSFPKQIQKFRIRDYFFDSTGQEYEFVQYLSDKHEERNDYSDL